MAAISPESPEPRVGPDGRSLVRLFSDLWRETSTLVRDEAELARAEIGEKVTQVEKGVVSIAVGATILLAGLIVLLFAGVGALGLAFDPQTAQWASPLIVGGVVMIIGAIALATGRSKLKSRNLTPERTLQSVRDDAQFAKEHVS